MPFTVEIDPIDIPWSRIDQPGRSETIAFRATETEDVERWREQWLPALSAGRRVEAEWPWPEHIEAAAIQAGRLCLALASKEKLHALISLTHDLEVSRIVSGAPIVYIEYVGNAPWHILCEPHERTFAGLGEFLVKASLKLSQDLGFGGRVGLHAKKDVETYYEHLGFTRGPLEQTEDGEWLYFESSAEKVETILARGRR